MRILFIVHRIPYPPNKGEKLRAFGELKELSRRHEVDLFCFYDDPEDEKHISQLSRYCRRCYAERLSWFWSRASAAMALLRGRSFSAAFFYSRRLAGRIRQALVSYEYDAILVFSSSMAQYVEKTSDVPRILDLVDVDSDKWLQYANTTSWPFSWMWRREGQRLGEYEAALVKQFSATLVCTEAEARLLRLTAQKGEIRVLENFIDTAEYDPERVAVSERIRSWQPYVLFSGSMDYLPNIDAATYLYRSIFPMIRREIPEARLVIAGRKPHASISALRSDPSVRITGRVPDMKPYICGASVAVVPMRIARGVQNKILEALACGVPVVSSKIAADALAEQLRGLVTVAESAEKIAACVVELLRNGSPIPSETIRTEFNRYIENLDLGSQLEMAMMVSTGRSAEDSETIFTREAAAL